jgi:ribosomal protein L22
MTEEKKLNSVEKKVEVKVEDKVEKIEEKKPEEKEVNENKSEKTKGEIKKEGSKKEVKKKEIKKPKKTEVNVRGINLPVSKKYAVALCKFIKNKPIEKAISDLKLVIDKRKPVPMKGEIAHRKGIMSGRFPKKASENFIELLQSLYNNANYFEIDEPIVFEAIANSGTRVYGRFGSIKRKRTHVEIKAKSGVKKK